MSDINHIDKFPRVTLQQASSQPKLDFVLPGLLAGSVGLVVGAGAVGKSYLALHIGLSVATGRSVSQGLWEPSTIGNVALIFGEDQPDIIQERLYWLRKMEGITDEEAELIDQRLEVISTSGFDMRIVKKSRDGIVDGPFIRALLELAKNKRLIIIDPLIFLSDLDENDNGAATQLMQTLQRIARETGTTIIVLHHTSKGGSGERDDWTAARGASAFTTACRWQVNLSLPNSKECDKYCIDDDMRNYWIRVAIVKANYGAPSKPSWLFRMDGGTLKAREIFKLGRSLSKKKKHQTKDEGVDVDDFFGEPI